MLVVLFSRCWDYKWVFLSTFLTLSHFSHNVYYFYYRGENNNCILMSFRDLNDRPLRSIWLSVLSDHNELCLHELRGFVPKEAVTEFSRQGWRTPCLFSPRCPRTSGEGTPLGAKTRRFPAGGWGAGVTSKPWVTRKAGSRTPAPKCPPSWPSGRSPCSSPSDRGRWETSKRKPPVRLPHPNPGLFSH